MKKNVVIKEENVQEYLNKYSPLNKDGENDQSPSIFDLPDSSSPSLNHVASKHHLPTRPFKSTLPPIAHYPINEGGGRHTLIPQDFNKLNTQVPAPLS